MVGVKKHPKSRTQFNPLTLSISTQHTSRHGTLMVGDPPLEDDTYHLKDNDLDLKLSDKHVSIAFIRPLWTFNLLCCGLSTCFANSSTEWPIIFSTGPWCAAILLMM